MSDFGDNYYALLGVTRDATPAEIQRAYHDKARQMHPDVNPDSEAPERFVQVQRAYEVLSEADTRAAYDRTLPEERDEPGQAFLGALYSRSMLARIPEPQLIYALLELKAQPVPPEATKPPLNVCLVLDRSTSMQGLRLDTLKTTSRKLIRQIRSQDYLSIVTFSDRAEVILPATRGLEIEKVEARISLLQSGGGTEIFRGLKEGFFEVTRNLNPSYINHLILITDGRTYGDEQDCIDLSEKARQQGVTISGLGIGTEWNDEFMDRLTGITGGSTVFVASDEDIQKFLELKFHGLDNIYAENLSLDYTKDPDVELKYAFRLDPDPGPLAQDGSLQLGMIPRDGTISVLFEFLVSAVPSDAERVTLIRGDLHMNVPTQDVPATSVNVHLHRPTSPTIDPEPPPQRIVKAMSKLTLYRMQEQARSELAEGKVEEATRRLQNLATHLLSQGERQLARTVLAEADRAGQSNSLSQQGEKRIKYGTRALLLPPNLEDMLA